LKHGGVKRRECRVPNISKKDFSRFLIDPTHFERIYVMSVDCGFETKRRVASPGTTTFRASNRFPKDLRAWLQGPALLRLAHSIAQEQTVSALHAVFSFSAARFHHPWRMLALLTYAYASGIWQSRAIAELAAIDPNLGALCHGEAPSVELIRRFRNHNRQVILRSLEQLIRRLWCHRFGQHVTALRPLLSVEILCDTRVRLQRAEQCEQEEPATGNHA
jgi:hypothetical protein